MSRASSRRAARASVSLAVSLVLHSCVRLVAATACGGQRSADASADLDRAGKRVPSATKISPAVIEVITAIRNHALAAFRRSRGRFVAADSSAIHTRRLRKGTTRRFQEVIYVTERAGATGNEDILSVHSDVRAQAMLQAQDLVLGFARFLGGSFAGSRAAGVSTDASEELTYKNRRMSQGWVAELDDHL